MVSVLMYPIIFGMIQKLNRIDNLKSHEKLEWKSPSSLPVQTIDVLGFYFTLSFSFLLRWFLGLFLYSWLKVFGTNKNFVFILVKTKLQISNTISVI